MQDGFADDLLTPENATSLSFSMFELKPKMPVSQQWNFNIQQQLGQNWVVEVGYYGAKANHLINRKDGNYSLPGPGNIDQNRRYKTAVWPTDSSITVGPLSSFSSHHWSGSSLYHSFQAKVEKRFSGGFTLLGSFIYSKTIGDVTGFSGSGNASNSNPQNPLDWRSDRSLDAQHMGKRFVTSYIYELPFGRGKRYGSSWNRAADAIVGGWALSGILTLHDGRPSGLSVNGNPSNATTVSRSDRPNVVGEWKLSREERTLDRFFNTDAFVKNRQYEFGNAGRNILIDPGRVNFDFSAFKRFVITERINLQFRFEAYNSTNTPPIGSPNRAVGNNSFGKVTGAGRPRNLQFGLKLLW